MVRFLYARAGMPFISGEMDLSPTKIMRWSNAREDRTPFLALPRSLITPQLNLLKIHELLSFSLNSVLKITGDAGQAAEWLLESWGYTPDPFATHEISWQSQKELDASIAQWKNAIPARWNRKFFSCTRWLFRLKNP